MAYYVSAFCQDNVHAGEGFRYFNFSQPFPAAVVHPDDAYNFYTSILAPAAQHWNMQHFFTDFLCLRGPRLARAMADAKSDYYAPSAAWLSGMTRAATDLGMETQYCMACAHQAMQSLAFPGVTNARVNGDGGLDLGDLPYSTTMAAAVGLGWSKDNLRLRVFEPGVTEIQTILAALSLGPVGLSDELVGYPAPLKQEEPPPPVLTNTTLAMSTCTSNGTLLQPSFPLTPVEDLLSGGAGSGAVLDPRAGQVWGTFTNVEGGVGPWFTAVGFSVGGGKTPPPQYPPYPLLPRHFTVLMDWDWKGCTPPTNPPDLLR